MWSVLSWIELRGVGYGYGMFLGGGVGRGIFGEGWGDVRVLSLNRGVA